MLLKQILRVGVQKTLIAVSLILTTIFGVFGTTVTLAAAQTIPYKINFQGRLTDTSGNILTDGSYNIKFRLYDAVSSGTLLWTENRVITAIDNRVTITNGLFNLQFGDLTSLPPSIINGTYPLYLEVELPTPASANCATNSCAVFTEGPMTPRQPLASAPYAYNSQTLGGRDSDGYVQLTPASVQTGSVNISGAIQTASTIQGTGATFTGATALTLGSASNAGSIVFNDGTGTARAVTLKSPALTGSYSLSLPTSAPSIKQCLQAGTTTASQLVFASCATSVTLQNVYDNSTDPELTLATGSTTGLTIKDASSAITGNLLEVTNNANTTTYFGVSVTGIAVTGTANVTTKVTTPAIDTASAGTLLVGTSIATAITLGKAGVAVSAPGGITTSNGTINTGSGTITSGAINSQTISAAALFTGTVSAATGFKINNIAAASGTFLRGDSTNFVASSLQAADLPAGSSNYVQINPGSQETGSFNVAGSGTVGTSLLSPLHDVAAAGTLSLGTATATAITLGKFGVTTNTAGTLAINSGTNIPTTDQVTIDNTSSTGVTTSGVNGLNVHYKGGAVAVEAAGMRVDYTSGGASGGIWSGMRIVENNATATGVTSYGLKLEGTTNVTGSNIAIKIAAGWDAGLEIATGSVDPATPAAGSIDVFARTVAGRSLLRQKGPSGVSFSYQPGLFEQALLYESPGIAGSISTIGGAFTLSGNITNPAPTEAIGSATNFATATNNLNAAGLIESAATHFRGSTVNSANGFFYVARLGLPDTTFNTTARTFTGLTDATVVNTMTASDTPTGNYAGFRLSTTAADTSWKFVTSNGTTASTPAASVTATSGHVYDLYIYSPTYSSGASITTMYWRVDDLTTGTTVEGSSTTNLPTATVALRVDTAIAATATGVVHNLRVLKHYVEADR